MCIYWDTDLKIYFNNKFCINQRPQAAKGKLLGVHWRENIVLVAVKVVMVVVLVVVIQYCRNLGCLNTGCSCPELTSLQKS